MVISFHLVATFICHYCKWLDLTIEHDSLSDLQPNLFYLLTNVLFFLHNRSFFPVEIQLPGHESTSSSAISQLESGCTHLRVWYYACDSLSDGPNASHHVPSTNCDSIENLSCKVHSFFWNDEVSNTSTLSRYEHADALYRSFLLTTKPILCQSKDITLLLDTSLCSFFSSRSLCSWCFSEDCVPVEMKNSARM